MRLLSILGRSLALGATIAVVTAGAASAAIPPPHVDGAEHGIALDARTGTVEPTDAQRATAAALGADVRWNRFGTPHSLFRVGGALASDLPSDPVAAAREFLRANSALFRLKAADVDDLEVVGNTPVGAGHAVLLRQRFGSLRAGTDGLVALAVMDGQVLYVTSTLSAGGTFGEATLSPGEVWLRAARELGLSVAAADMTDTGEQDGWHTFQVAGLADTQRARLVAVPTYTQGVRSAYETIVLDHGRPLAATTFVDARSGEVLVRHDRVNYAGEPAWTVFPASPPLDYAATDTRQRWCWTAALGCDRVLSLAAPRGGTDGEWDRLQGRIPGVATFFPVTFTTLGNNADTAEAWLSPLTPAEKYRPVALSRDYAFPWANTWYESNCDPTVLTPQGNDIDAATANLFAMHDRMHDWSYHLGFTERTWNMQYHNFGDAPTSARENDAETGDAQAGALNLGPANAVSRDNANQITLNDGIPGITNMYLWQSLPAAAYVPCVDGDFDMAIIGHEYTHAISNRMVAGPDAGLSGAQAGAMGESWSDLVGVEHLNEYGFVPLGGENPFAVGAYVTGDHERGVRNYAMNASPLNYSDIQYDFGSQVHADGEIWSATNFDIRAAMIARYGAGDRAAQERCANGDLPAQTCPGNRRWAQLVFDAWLLMQSGVDMVDARNAMLVVDQMRFAGANQDLLWNAFARRGLGEGASSAGTSDNNPQPDFTSPFAREADVTFEPVAAKGGPRPESVDLFVGDYEARVVPIADTDPGTTKDAAAAFVSGHYTFVARADGFGHVRFERTLKAGQKTTIRITMPENVASSHRGATASGDGTNHGRLIDDAEATNWASAGSPPVEGRQATVDLAGDAARAIEKVRVSAMLIGGGNRFAALRKFEIRTCTRSSTVACDQPGQFEPLFTSLADAFPGEPFRPRAPELILRTFDVPDTTATHVRLRVLTNQCTGNPAFQGDQDSDPTSDSDCVRSQSHPGLLPPQGGNVVAAELQVVG